MAGYYLGNTLVGKIEHADGGERPACLLTNRARVAHGVSSIRKAREAAVLSCTSSAAAVLELCSSGVHKFVCCGFTYVFAACSLFCVIWCLCFISLSRRLMRALWSVLCIPRNKGDRDRGDKDRDNDRGMSRFDQDRDRRVDRDGCVPRAQTPSEGFGADLRMIGGGVGELLGLYVLSIKTRSFSSSIVNSMNSNRSPAQQ